MPAGDLEKAKIAYQFGADACYGSTSAFSMRTREIGFNYKTLKEAIDYAHSLGKKFYITLNTYPHEYELTKIRTHARKLINMNPDAIILADPGIIAIVNKEINKARSQKIKAKTNSKTGTYNLAIKQLNNIELHLSTQANATNSEAIKFWAQNGISRIVLPRELSIKEIAEIRRRLPKKIMLEAFVHGAMCNSVSGRCNLSNYLSYRDANRGACVQACRWKYSLVEEKRPGQFIPVGEDENGSYIYNSKDLNMIEHLKDLHNAGIESFKVEGRNKSIYYCAIVARAYRKAIDNLSKSRNQAIIELKRELETVTNRGYSTGFYYGRPTDADINYETSRPSSDWQFVGLVEKQLSSKCYLVEARNELKVGTELEIVTPSDIFKTKLKSIADQNNNIVQKVNPNSKFILNHKMELPINTFLRAK